MNDDWMPGSEAEAWWMLRALLECDGEALLNGIGLCCVVDDWWAEDCRASDVFRAMISRLDAKLNKRYPAWLAPRGEVAPRIKWCQKFMQDALREGK